MSLFWFIHKIAYSILLYNMFYIIFYPYKYNNFIMDTSHYCILQYSKCQLFFNKKYKNLKKRKQIGKYIVYIEKFVFPYFNSNIHSNNIEVIKDGEVVNYTNTTNFVEPNKDLMDFMVYSNKIEKNMENIEEIADVTDDKLMPINKVIYFNIPTNFNYEKCKYKFVSVIIEFSKDEQYNLKLYNDYENYYIVNNRINKFILCYLIRKNYKIIKDDFFISYKLTIIDHNILILNLNENDEILLNIDNYVVLPFTNKLTPSLSLEEMTEKKQVDKLLTEYIQVKKND